VGGEVTRGYRSPGNGDRRSLTASSVDADRDGLDRVEAERTSGGFARPAFTLDQVRTFLAVANLEHVTQAARLLRLSQSAVTQQIQLLERALGVQLLERVGRNVQLTNAGVEVAAACLLIMRALDNLQNVVRSVRDLNRGAVSVGASQLAATHFLPGVIAEFARAYPQVRLAVVVASSDEACQQVASGDLDCALVDGTPPPVANLLQTWVAATEVVMVAHPSHAGAVPDPDMLNSSCHLVWSPGSASETLATRLFGEDDGRGPRVYIESMETARRLVRESPGFVAAMPLIGVHEDLVSGALARLGPRSETLPVFAVRRDGSASPAREALWQLLIRRPNGAGHIEGI
jgi:DNA-binding transcriptional LysR family regulator